MRPARKTDARRKARLTVKIERSLKQGRIPRKLMVAAVEQVGQGEKLSGSIRIIVVGDFFMRDLNRKFRMKDKPTDVLAFPLGKPFPSAGASPLIGEVYCNYDHARRWHREHGGTIAAELSRLAVHGALHLAGYDHHRPGERKQMTAAENRYLCDAGLLEMRT
ncbi:MAG: rRNA maturation RNase YbeY [candidate division Zixibacteria bacterium]|nr:rRNA maturation RNase YbeY [candidate division Zixibacteria bacterium]